MIDIPSGFFKDVLRVLGRHGPHPILAFALFVAFLFSPYFGVEPAYALGALAIVWSGYFMACVASARHKERIAQIGVDKLEKTRGKQIKNRQRARLQRPK